MKAFAAGVILATGFIHVLPDGFKNLASPCSKENPWSKFPLTGSIAMLAAIGTLMVDAHATSHFMKFHKPQPGNNRVIKVTTFNHEHVKEKCSGPLVQSTLNLKMVELTLEHFIFQFMASFMSEVLGKTIKFVPSQIVLTCGANPATEILCNCVADPGDVFLIHAPYYPGFNHDMKIRTTVEFIPVHTRSSDNFVVTIDALDEAYDQATKQGKRVEVILFANPSNPVGTVFTKETLLSFLDFAREKNIHILSDEIYAGSRYGDEQFVIMAEIVDAGSIDDGSIDKDRVHIVDTLMLVLLRLLPTLNSFTTELFRRFILELEIIVHFVIVGIALGASESPSTIKPLVAALCFHQLFEVIGLGGCIMQEQFRTWVVVIMTIISLTTSTGSAIGIGITNVYHENSPTALIVQGLYNSASAGILINMALVDFLAADCMNPKLQSNI